MNNTLEHKILDIIIERNYSPSEKLALNILLTMNPEQCSDDELNASLKYSIIDYLIDLFEGIKQVFGERRYIFAKHLLLRHTPMYVLKNKKLKILSESNISPVKKESVRLEILFRGPLENLSTDDLNALLSSENKLNSSIYFLEDKFFIKRWKKRVIIEQCINISI